MGNHTVDPSKPSPFVKKGLEAFTVRGTECAPSLGTRLLTALEQHPLGPPSSAQQRWRLHSPLTAVTFPSSLACAGPALCTLWQPQASMSPSPPLACCVQNFSAALFILVAALVITIDSALEGQSHPPQAPHRRVPTASVTTPMESIHRAGMLACPTAAAHFFDLEHFDLEHVDHSSGFEAFCGPPTETTHICKLLEDTGHKLLILFKTWKPQVRSRGL